MSKPYRSAQDWLCLIDECRRSGLTDAEWCRQHEIRISTFYNAVSRLLRKNFTIPEPAGPVSMDLTAANPLPDIVPVSIVPEEPALPAAPAMQEPAAQHIDNSHMIEISMAGSLIRISNGTDPALLETVLRIMRTASC